MTTRTRLRSGAGAAESDPFAQVRGFMGHITGLGSRAILGIAWGGPTMIMAANGLAIASEASAAAKGTIFESYF